MPSVASEWGMCAGARGGSSSLVRLRGQISVAAVCTAVTLAAEAAALAERSGRSASFCGLGLGHGGDGEHGGELGGGGVRCVLVLGLLMVAGESS